jgi:hypothetical protein
VDTPSNCLIAPAMQWQSRGRRRILQGADGKRLGQFTADNVVGMHVVLEAARQHWGPGSQVRRQKLTFLSFKLTFLSLKLTSLSVASHPFSTGRSPLGCSGNPGVQRRSERAPAGG